MTNTKARLVFQNKYFKVGFLEILAVQTWRVFAESVIYFNMKRPMKSKGFTNIIFSIEFYCVLQKFDNGHVAHQKCTYTKQRFSWHVYIVSHKLIIWSLVRIIHVQYKIGRLL